ncbi:MAG: transposase [Rhodospirillales bacterium]|nr:transposase [Rhodospirillales bacterium]
MEIITGVERRRRWRVTDKLRILAEAEQPGMSFAEVARRHEISRGLLQTWRRQFRDGLLRDGSPPTFMPVQITGPGDVPALAVLPGPRRGVRRAGLIEIDLGSGRRIRVDRDVDADALRRVLEALAPR